MNSDRSEQLGMEQESELHQHELSLFKREGRWTSPGRADGTGGRWRSDCEKALMMGGGKR